MSDQKRTNRNNRARGKAFEKRVVKVFQKYGFDCRRMPFSGAVVEYGKGDIEFLDEDIPLFVECKNFKWDIYHELKLTALPAILDKAVEQAGDSWPIVVLRDTKGDNTAIMKYYNNIDEKDFGLPINVTFKHGVEWIILPLEEAVKGLAGVYAHILERSGDRANTESPSD